MRPVLIVVLLIAAVLALLPPFFTRGACTAEFDASADALTQARPQLTTLESAQSYLSSNAMPFTKVSAELCPRWPGIEACEDGPVLLVHVPVKNTVCRYYRSGSIQVQLSFNRRSQLVHYAVDMPPYHFLKLPMVGIEISWAK
jgi:hypothetical protein